MKIKIKMFFKTVVISLMIICIILGAFIGAENTKTVKSAKPETGVPVNYGILSEAVIISNVIFVLKTDSEALNTEIYALNKNYNINGKKFNPDKKLYSLNELFPFVINKLAVLNQSETFEFLNESGGFFVNNKKISGNAFYKKLSEKEIYTKSELLMCAEYFKSFLNVLIKSEKIYDVYKISDIGYPCIAKYKKIFEKTFPDAECYGYTGK